MERYQVHYLWIALENQCSKLKLEFRFHSFNPSGECVKTSQQTFNRMNRLICRESVGISMTWVSHISKTELPSWQSCNFKLNGALIQIASPVTSRLIIYSQHSQQVLFFKQCIFSPFVWQQTQEKIATQLPLNKIKSVSTRLVQYMEHAFSCWLQFFFPECNCNLQGGYIYHYLLKRQCHIKVFICTLLMTDKRYDQGLAINYVMLFKQNLWNIPAAKWGPMVI